MLRPATERSLTIAALATGGAARLDRHAGLTAPSGAWTVDWAARTAEGWHVASADAAVRQTLVDATPVVVSSLRVPDGAIEHRCWAAVVAGVPFAVIELTNVAPVAVAVALLVRSVERHPVPIELVDSEIRVDGSPSIWMARPPSRTAIGAVASVMDDVDGLDDAAGAFVFPLPHTATLRLAMALSDVPLGTAIDVASMVPSETVVSGWHAQTAASPRIDLPERDAESAIDAARRHLLVHAGLCLRTGVDDDAAGLAAEMAMALDEHGLHVTARDLLLGALASQRTDGSFGDGGTDTTARVLIALDRHRRLSGDDSIVADAVGAIAAGARRLGRRRRWARRRDATAPVEMRRRALALESAARSLRAAEQPDAAALVDAHAIAVSHEMAARRIDPRGDGDGRAPADAVDRLRALLVEGASCWTWPSAEHGDDPWRTAAFLRLVRALLVDDDGDGVDLLPVPIADWYGTPLAVHELPTTAGRLSFALRWHGARPALLWERTGGVGADGPSGGLSASTLDPHWTSTEPRSEALLAEPPHVHDHLPMAVESGASGTAVPVRDDPAAGGSFT